jgi:hypothetical protein
MCPETRCRGEPLVIYLYSHLSETTVCERQLALLPLERFPAHIPPDLVVDGSPHRVRAAHPMISR